VKLLSSLFNSTFPYEKLEEEIYENLISKGYFKLIKKILIHLGNTLIQPNKILVKNTIKAYLNNKDLEYIYICNNLAFMIWWKL